MPDHQLATTVLAPIRKREQSATPGPWETTERHGIGADDEGWSELTVKSPSGVVAMTYWTDALETSSPEADGAFISNARADIPRLLAALYAALKLADDWDAAASNPLRITWNDPAANEAASVSQSLSVSTRRRSAAALREAIARALLGEENENA